MRLLGVSFVLLVYEDMCLKSYAVGICAIFSTIVAVARIVMRMP
jgi:hypothetical protein